MHGVRAWGFAGDRNLVKVSLYVTRRPGRGKFFGDLIADMLLSLLILFALSLSYSCKRKTQSFTGIAILSLPLSFWCGRYCVYSGDNGW